MDKNKEVIKPCFNIPEDTRPDEFWSSIPKNYYTVGINPVYKISNLGRVLNSKTNTVLHVYKRLGYQYVTLGMNNKYKCPGQGNIDRRNFTIADLVLHTFRPVENSQNVKPLYLGDRSDVYVDKRIDGKIQSNIKWQTADTNNTQFWENKISKADVHKICQLFEFGWSINRVCLEMNHILPKVITDIYRHRLYIDITNLYDF